MPSHPKTMRRQRGSIIGLRKPMPVRHSSKKPIHPTIFPPAKPLCRNAAPTCPVCLDLTHDLFRETPSLHRADTPDIRWHVVHLKQAQYSSKACKLCYMIYEGVTSFWDSDDTAPEHQIESETGSESSNEGTVQDNNAEELDYADLKEIYKTAETIKYYRKAARGIYPLLSEEDIRKGGQGPNRIFLESRPGKPLWASRVQNPQRLDFRGSDMRLEFYTKPGGRTKHPAFGISAHVPSKLNLTHCTKVLKRWLHECRTQHDSCLDPSPRLPKRVLRVSGKNIQLVNTDALAYSSYVTLSHCWGRSHNMLMTTKANIECRIEKIDWTELPRIFKDAIKVTRSIDCEWIWIDSLCIIQDDDEDWREESAKMADIYSNSLLNISATSSSSNSGSFFSHRKYMEDDMYNRTQGLAKTKIFAQYPNMRVYARMTLTQGHEYMTDYIREIRHLGEKIPKRAKGRAEAAPLLERAWAFQERLLAPRTLHFGSSELVWDCNTCFKCECTGISTVDHLTRGLKVRFAEICQGRASKEGIHDFWLQVVKMYSSLCLTKVSDRPIALAGVASRIADKLASDYLAGIWAADLARNLLWFIPPVPILSSHFRERPSPNFPTWSWMSQSSWDSSCVVWFLWNSGEMIQNDRLHMHKLDTFCNCVDANPFGSVISGQLTLTGAVKRGIIRFVSVEGQDYGVRITPFRASFFAVDCPHIDKLRYHTEVLCLLIGNCRNSVDVPNFQYVLVLKLLDGTAKYTRVGVAVFSLDEGDPFEDAKTRKVTIV